VRGWNDRRTSSRTLQASSEVARAIACSGTFYYIQDDIHVVPRLVFNVGPAPGVQPAAGRDDDRFSVSDLSINPLNCSPTPDASSWRAPAAFRVPHTPTFTDFARASAWCGLMVGCPFGFWHLRDSSSFNLSIFPNPPFYQ